MLSHAYLNVQMAIVLMQMYAQERPEFFQFFVQMLKPIISEQRVQKLEKKNREDKIPAILTHLKEAAEKFAKYGILDYVYILNTLIRHVCF